MSDGSRPVDVGDACESRWLGPAKYEAFGVVGICREKDVAASVAAIIDPAQMDVFGREQRDPDVPMLGSSKI